MAAFDEVLSGSYTSTGAAKFISLPCGADVFEVFVQGSAAGDVWANNPAVVGVNRHAFWQAGMAADSALVDQNTAVVGESISQYLSANGILPVQSQASLLGPAVLGTQISAANPAVMTITPADAFNTGDVVLLEAGVGNTSKQMLGIPWSVTKTGANTYTLDNAFDSSALTAAGPIVARKLLYPGVFSPYLSYIVALGLGASTSVTTSYPHGLSVGQSVRLVVPSPWGATALNGQQGVITSVPGSHQFVVAINSSAASAFAFPSVAQAAAGVSWPQVIPFAEDASQFVGSASDNNYKGIIIGSAVCGPAGALVCWRAQKSTKVYSS